MSVRDWLNAPHFLGIESEARIHTRLKAASECADLLNLIATLERLRDDLDDLNFAWEQKENPAERALTNLHKAVAGMRANGFFMDEIIMYVRCPWYHDGGI